LASPIGIDAGSIAGIVLFALAAIMLGTSVPFRDSQAHAGATLTTMDVTTETFEAEVIERSRERPVVVDSWDGWPVPFGLESRGLGADRQP
jgi:hypothetical protein